MSTSLFLIFLGRQQNFKKSSANTQQYIDMIRYHIELVEHYTAMMGGGEGRGVQRPVLSVFALKKTFARSAAMRRWF
jgi:hypothetical protein